jgi:hypothetical protein
MTETTEYVPQIGDVIVFPDALMAVNRTMRYIVTGADDVTVMFEHEEGRGGRFAYPVGKLRAIGMRRAETGA